MSDPNIWRPGNTIDADNTIAHQSFTATAGQSLFTLTDFVYSPDTSTLMVAVAGLEQRPGIDFTETSFDSFTLTTPVQAGTVVFARAVTKLTAAKLMPGQVDNSHLADMAAGTIKGRESGSGTGSPVDLSAAQVKTILSLNNVTNNAQTNAAVVPNTVPSSGQLLIGNSGGSYTPKTVGGHATIDLNGNVTLANSGVAPGTYTKVIVDNKGRVTSGGFLASGDVPTLNQNTTGNAGTATALQNARNINGIPFNGTADITINAVDSTPRIPTSAIDTDGTLSADSDNVIPSQKAVKYYVDNMSPVQSAVTIIGNLDASSNPNYPPAATGDAYSVTVAGKVGGASGVTVGAGDLVVAKVANAGGDQATVGADWTILGASSAGALQASLNLSDLPSPSTARSNLGLGDSSTLNVGTAAGTVAAGDDSRILNGAAAYGWGDHSAEGYAKTKSDVGLSNVTNDVQTKASTVPNTVPSSGQVLVGNGTAYVPRTVSGAITLSAAGIATLNSQVVTNAKLANMAGGTMKCRFPGSATGEPADFAIGSVMAAANYYATAKSTPHDNDLFGLSDSQDGWSLKKLTWAQLKAAVGSANPSVTGTVTLSNTPNTVALTDIVTDLGLVIGDVINISGVGLRRIDSIPDNNSVVVNSAHSTNQSNGPLVLPSNSMSRTITLVAKWYNAARGLGQAFVERSGQRAIGVSSNWGSSYQGAPGNVPTDVIIGAVLSSGTSWLEVEIGGIAGIAASGMAGIGNSKVMLSFTVPPGASFRLRTNSVSYSALVWMEYR